MALRVETVDRGRAGRTRFWRAGLAPYAGDPHFVTPLLADCHTRWHPEHPLFEHAQTQHFVAVRDGRDVGRVAATVDAHHDAVHGGATGFFGWFECEQAQETADALLGAAAAWLRERGRTEAIGPLGYTTNGISGLLVEADEPGPPLLDMPHNPAWYPGLLERAGFEGAKDLLAFWVPAQGEAAERLARIADRALERGGYVLRAVRADRRGFAADVEHVLRIYNGAWERNWGFVPMTPHEIRHEARSLRQVLEPSMLLFAEHRGEPVAFSLTLPDVNQALARIRGRLWPWSLVRFLLARRSIDRGRVLTLGVLPEHRRAGLEAALIVRTVRRARELGWSGGECSWVLEDNHLMIAAIERVGGRPYRRYRLYRRSLGAP